MRVTRGTHLSLSPHPTSIHCLATKRSRLTDRQTRPVHMNHAADKLMETQVALATGNWMVSGAVWRQGGGEGVEMRGVLLHCAPPLPGPLKRSPLSLHCLLASDDCPHETE